MPNATITSAGNIACNNITSTGNVSVSGSITVNGFPFRGFKETIALQSVKSTAGNTGNSQVDAWSTTYVVSGGTLKITIYISCYVQTIGSKSWSIQKKGRGTTWNTVATGSYYFNQTWFHLPMPALSYIDTTQAAYGTSTQWRVFLETGTHIDANDTCTMTITEY